MSPTLCCCDQRGLETVVCQVYVDRFDQVNNAGHIVFTGHLMERTVTSEWFIGGANNPRICHFRWITKTVVHNWMTLERLRVKSDCSMKFIRSKMKRNRSQAIFVSGRSNNSLGFIAAQSTLVCGFFDCFVSSQQSVQGSLAPPINCDLYFHRRSKIIARPLTAAQTVIKAVCNFADHACRLHQRDSSCSLTYWLTNCES